MKISEDKFCTDLWYEYEPQLRKICETKMQSCPDDIDDIISETFLALCDKVSESGPPEKVRAWLYGTLYHFINSKYRTIYRTERKSVALHAKEYILPYDWDIENDIVEACDAESTMKEINATLNEQERFLIQSVYGDGRKFKDVAEELNTTASAVKQKSYRVNIKVRKIASKKNN